ncbi:MAG: hypothetical protein QMC96_09940 [Methanomicrobiales archaeon]|nr:hypothetical protein [Methanomicrobiales archaeon]
MDEKTRYPPIAWPVTKSVREGCEEGTPSGKGNSEPAPGSDCYRWSAGQQGCHQEFCDHTAFVQDPHVRLKGFEAKPNNNVLERLNGTFQERTNVVRGLDSPCRAQEFAAGMRIYYNCIRPHQRIGV